MIAFEDGRTAYYQEKCWQRWQMLTERIKDEEIIYRLGSIVCDVSCSVLREFSRNLKAIESERRIGYVRRNDLQGSGRTALSADRDAGRDGGSHEAGQIRKDGDELSQRERAGKIQDADEIREDVREDVSGRGGSESADRKSTRLNSSHSAKSRMPSSA